MLTTKNYSWLIAALLTVCAGCESLGTGPEESSRYARLPTGLTLLDTDSGGRCAGNVQVREEESGKRDDEIVLKPGENATFAIEDDDDEIEWSCIGGERSVGERIDCPDATSHVRILRTADRGDVTTECYGRRNRG
jgi:hypothetical protein